MNMFSELLLVILALAAMMIQILCEASDGADQRYSYSLTTFDPSGKLNQVERAMQAAEQGTPIVGIVKSDSVLMAAPQILPSPALTLDDGTSRFSLVTPEIMISHSGLSADGRVLVAAAQRLAVEHEYTFDENIGIGIFLEELSLLFQEYTMKPATRPFGASLIVAYVPSTQSQLLLSDSSDGKAATPELFRIDPSGNVQDMGRAAVVHGNLERTNLHARLSEIIKQESSIDDDKVKVVDLLKDALRQQATKKRGNDSSIVNLTILTATLTRTDDADGSVFRKERHEKTKD